MKPPRLRKPLTNKTYLTIAAAGVLLVMCVGMLYWYWWPSLGGVAPYTRVATVAGTSGEFGEPFGIAANGSGVYVSDGQAGKIWVLDGHKPRLFAEGLATPSAIAFDSAGNLIVADSGSHTIKSIDRNGKISIVAGVDGRPGFADGAAAEALFNAPIGIAVAPDGRIYVADTYNDRIRVVAKTQVTTLAGSDKGFADGLGESTRFDTPCGIAVWQDKVLVADTGNRRIRIVEADGRVWTLSGNDEGALHDGLLAAASFVQPTAVVVDAAGSIIVADGNAIRQIGPGTLPMVRTISDERRGFRDGEAARSRFNRPSSLAVDNQGSLIVTDSDNALVRRFVNESPAEPAKRARGSARAVSADEFRTLQPPRWPYNPPSAKRDIAGTLGEIRGEVSEKDGPIWFHNGFDIAGAYGETARFVRDEKVLLPVAAENFATQRELLRMPMIGYIHIRLGRDSGSVPFGDGRFQFTRDKTGKMTGVRVPRGTTFRAGEAIGTLNALNHVHLIAGPSGAEMNALDALIWPNLTDTRPPTIEKVTIFDQHWSEINAVHTPVRLAGATRIVVRAFDQADGNSDRRRLGVYSVGYQVLRPDGTVPIDEARSIVFDRMPDASAVRLVYANGSRSGATGETVFNYIATNRVSGDESRERLLDTSALEPGVYTLRAVVADYFGNIAVKEIAIEVPAR